MLLLLICLAAAVLGVVIPARWGVLGFVGSAALLFVIFAGINAASGFARTSIEESLLLFNGSWVSYLGFNAQITYRAFAPVLLALAVPLIYRLARR
ncbi:MAG: hypothetical protein ACU0GG_08100 [Paracoccaceae bacterium]